MYESTGETIDLTTWYSTWPIYPEFYPTWPVTPAYRYQYWPWDDTFYPSQYQLVYPTNYKYCPYCGKKLDTHVCGE